jgi:hypothetical protein
VVEHLPNKHKTQFKPQYCQKLKNQNKKLKRKTILGSLFSTLKIVQGDFISKEILQKMGWEVLI